MGVTLGQNRRVDGSMALRGGPPQEWDFPARWIRFNSQDQPVMKDEEVLYIDDEGKPAKRIETNQSVIDGEPVVCKAFVERTETEITLTYVNAVLVYHIESVTEEELTDGSVRATYHTILQSATEIEEV